jgi:predicted MFS family arabinose efflux permease
MSAEAIAHPGTQLTPAAKRSMVGGIISLLVDSYDIYLPALVLPAATGYFEPKSMAPTLKVTLVTVVFTVTLLGRPIGGPIFGNLGDKIGRKRVTIIAGAGFTVTTLLIACIPGYHQWGYGSIGALIALRLIDGIFLGGGYAGPVPLAIERSPKRMRGLVGGLVAAGAPVAVTLISVIQILVLKRMALPAFLSWGWRLPFFFGVVLGVAYLIYYWRVPEVDLGLLEASRKSRKQPLFQLFSGKNFGDLLQVFLLMTGMWFAAQIMLSFLPGLLIGVLHQNPADVSMLEIVASLIIVAGMTGYGVLSQKIGRRRTLICSGASVAVGGSLAFVFMVQLAHAGSGFLPVAVMAFIGLFLANSPLGCIVVYLVERFGAGIRSSGYGTAYTASLILPALYSVWIGALKNVMSYDYAAVVLIALGGVLFLTGAVIGPETREVELLAETPAPAGATAARGVVGRGAVQGETA